MGKYKNIYRCCLTHLCLPDRFFGVLGNVTYYKFNTWLNMHQLRYILIFLCISILGAQAAIAAEADIIAVLTKKIAESGSEDDKSRLYMYRARNYKNRGEYEKARDDYDDALSYNHQGWIHLERGRFFMARKNYEQAIREAVAAQEETPTLKKESQAIIVLASKKFKEKLNRENPQEILLTSVWHARTTAAGRKTSGRASVVGGSSMKSSAATQNRRVSRS